MKKSDNRTPIIVVGYPKSGNTWLCRLLGDVLDSPVRGLHLKPPLAAEGEDRNGDYIIYQAHLRPVWRPDEESISPDIISLNVPRLTNERVVHIIRDPRDIVVAVNHYWQLHNIDKAIDAVAEGQHPLATHGNWVGFINSWAKSPLAETVLTTTFYETLSGDTKLALSFILNGLGVTDVSKDAISSTVERQSFDIRKEQIREHGQDLPYGRETQLGNLRKGVVGDWENHFDRAQAKRAHEYFGELMTILGYEPETNWWANLPA